MELWTKFLDSLDTNGGHVVVTFVLFLMGSLMLKLGIEAGKEVTSLGLGALLLALKGNNRNGIGPKA